ncbi:MAG: DUF4406 domain-containing protein [Lachnospiraceae bacterium]|nr:DUF4406 domain-containing protein [Lachnospiraceae bacterium]
MRIYISGKITGTTDYMQRFQKAQEYLESSGYSVVNPARINAEMPKDTTWQQYMAVSLTLLETCEAIYMIDGWKDSEGARTEYNYAVTNNINVYYEKGEEL